MNTVSALFGGDLIQRRGGIIPGSPPQERCDDCEEPLNPNDAIEVTVTTPEQTIRLHGHRRCQVALGARVAVLVGGPSRG